VFLQLIAQATALGYIIAQATALGYINVSGIRNTQATDNAVNLRDKSITLQYVERAFAASTNHFQA